MPQFSAHLGYLFGEHPFPGRIAAARQAGFAAIEHPGPYAIPAAVLRSWLEQEGLSFVQLALPAGDARKGEKGFAASPGRTREFRDSVEVGLDYARTARARFIHVQSGIHPIGYEPELVWDTYLTHLSWACEKAAQADVGVLIEPIGPATLPNYFMSRMPQAVLAIRTLQCPNLRMLYDVFHGRSAGDDPAFPLAVRLIARRAVQVSAGAFRTGAFLPFMPRRAARSAFAPSVAAEGEARSGCRMNETMS